MKRLPRRLVQLLGFVVCLLSVYRAVGFGRDIVDGSIQVGIGFLAIFICLGVGVGTGLIFVCFEPRQVFRFFFGGAFKLHHLVDRGRSRSFKERLHDFEDEE